MISYYFFKRSGAKLYCRFTIDRNTRLAVVTNLPADGWELPANNDESKRMPQQYFRNTEKNGLLDKEKNRINSFLKKLDALQLPTIEQKQAVKEFMKFDEASCFIKPSASITDVMERYLVQKQNTVKPETFKTLKTLRYNIEHSQLVDKGINDITIMDILNFKNGLVDRKKQNSTIFLTLSQLKAFFKWAYNMKLSTNEVFQNDLFPTAPTKAERIKKRPMPLRYDEVERLAVFKFENPTHQIIVDQFIIMCRTGARYSDLCAFSTGAKNKLVKRGGVPFWEFYAIKTGDFTSIPLVGFCDCSHLLYKYAKIQKFSAKQFSKYLRTALKIAGINRPIEKEIISGVQRSTITEPIHHLATTKVGRATFISILLNKFKLPITSIMPLTGHDDVSTVMHYAELEAPEAILENIKATK